MGDIFVHLRMKACCRTALAEIDKEKNKAKGRSGIMGVASLATTLGEKTIDAAKVAIPEGGALPSGGGADVEMERVTRELCAKLADKHADEHEGKGETEEAGFWRDLGASFQGKLLAFPTDAASLEKAGALKKAASEALKKYPDACNQSTAAIASAMGHPELEGKLANDQVAYLEKHGRKLDAKAAQEMANRGELVIAGLAEEGHGHVAVVVPGRGKFKMDGKVENFYPNVMGGALGGTGSAGYSNGTKTAGDVWAKKKRQGVAYWGL